MKKILLIGSLIIVVGLVAFFLIMAFSERFQVSFISPHDSTSVFSDFSISMMITPSDLSEVDIYIDGEQYKTYEKDSINGIDISGSKLWSIPISMKNYSSGGHRIQIYFKGGIFTKNIDRKIFVNYYQLHSNPIKPTSEELNSVGEYLKENIQDLFIKLNNIRYSKEKWQSDTEYKLTKKEVFNIDIPKNIKDKIFKIIEQIEQENSYPKISSAVNTLNYELQEQGYPYMAVLIDYTSNEKYRTTLLLTYEISGVIPVNIDSVTVNTFLLKRMDRVDVKELFNGAVQENSPYAFVLEDQARSNAKDILSFIDGDIYSSDKFIRKKTNGNLSAEELKKVSEEIRDELKALPSSNDNAFEVSVRDVAIHESRHVLDYRLGNPLSKSVVQILSHIYNKPIGDKPTKEDAANIQTAFETLLQINPEFSALLYTLAKNQGNRKYTLMKLFEYISDSYYDNSPYFWAAKLIFARMDEGAGNSFHQNIIFEPFSSNKKEWTKPFMNLINLNPDSLGSIAEKIYSQEFGISNVK